MLKTVSFVGLLLICFLNHATAQDPAKAAALATGFQKGIYELSDYNTACYFALADDKKLAFTFLRKAVAEGMSDLNGLLGDGDLASLHNEKEWAVLVQQVRANQSNSSGSKKMFFNQAGFWESNTFKTSYREDISEDEKIAGLSKFWSEAKYNFVNFDLAPSVNIDSLYYAWLPKVRQTKSTKEYFRVLSQLCSQLRDGHTNIFAPAELYNEIYARPLLRTRLIEDRVLIIAADQTLEAKGIRKGMEVVKVNGLPVKEYAATFINPYESYSTPQDSLVRSFDSGLFWGSTKDSIQLVLKDEKGRQSQVNVARVTPAERSKKMRTGPFTYKTLPGNIAYLGIHSFDTDTASAFFRNNYESISASAGLIIDLRENGGGNTDLEILTYLVDSAATVSKMYTRQYIAAHRPWGRLQATWGTTNGIQPNESKRYTKPVILLVSPRTYSAAEDFAVAFQTLKCGLILGEATGGSTGQPLFINLPGNIRARICTKRDQFPNGDEFIGKGVLPDIKVSPTVKDLRKGIDTELEAALKEIKKQNKPL